MMVELAVRAAAAVVRGPQPSVKCHVVASPGLPRYQTARDTQFPHILASSHSAWISGLAKLAELHNREELYRRGKLRQYRNLRRKFLAHK